MSRPDIIQHNPDTDLLLERMVDVPVDLVWRAWPGAVCLAIAAPHARVMDTGRGLHKRRREAAQLDRSAAGR